MNARAEAQSAPQAQPAPPRLARRDDQEFLPAALSILERPPSPIAGWLMASICALATAALAWAWIGHTDIVAVASGKIQPSGRVRTVQTLETGRVKAILARNGDSVRQGDVLVELDADEAVEEVRSLQASLHSALAEAARRGAAIRTAGSGAGPLAADWPPEVPPAVRRTQEAVLAADLAHLAQQIATLDAQRVQKLAERERLASTIRNQRVLIATQQERVDLRETLARSNSGTRSSLIDALEALHYQNTVLATQEGQFEEAGRAVEALAAERDRALQAFLADNETRRAQALREVDELAPRLAKAQLRVSRMTLRSPATGIVQASSVTSLGQVLTVGQEAMRVVPQDEGLEVEVTLANKDIGFVRVGQPATLKLEAFPFTRYGTLPATVVRVASDAIPDPDARQADADPTRSAESRFAGAGQRVQNLVFPVVLHTPATALSADGQMVPLSPGMAVTAEIKTGTRRIIDYVLSPLVETASTAGRER